MVNGKVKEYLKKAREQVILGGVYMRKWWYIGLCVVLVVGIGVFVFTYANRNNSSTTKSAEQIISQGKELSDNILKEYMEKENIKLTAKDVQYDMSNNVDEFFAISGIAELSTYYNYGFSHNIEDDYFAIRVSPIGGTYSDAWYLYCDRNVFGELFNILKKQSQTYIYGKCIIPSEIYVKGQQNMAWLKEAFWQNV